MHRSQLPCILTLRFFHFQGRNALGDHWSQLAKSLTGKLDAVAAEAATGGPLWQWHFSDLPLALRAWHDAVQRCKADFGWKPEHGSMPVQVLLDLPQGAGGAPGGQWDVLLPEVLNFTAGLYQEWQILADPEHDGAPPAVVDAGENVVRAVAAGGEEPRPLVMFPGRGLPLRKPGPRCFYCGRTDHLPASCPSKLLGPEVHGLTHTGYLSLPQLVMNYERAFADEARLLNKVRDAEDPAVVRADPELQAYLAFFDLTRTFQLRTLLYLCFVQVEGWPGVGPLGRAKPTHGNTLHLALDCLRVGNLPQAIGLLTTLEGVNNKDRFYVEVAIAFAALEQGDHQQLRLHLDRARKIAKQPEQRTYAALLRSRYYELYGGAPGRSLAVKAVLDAAGRFPEVEYRVFQLSARGGLEAGLLGQLRTLIRQHREYFLVALLDPDLAGVAGTVDGMLASLFEETLALGRTAFDEVKAEAGSLRDWLGESSRGLKSVLTGLASLESRAKRESFFGFGDLRVTADKLRYVTRDAKTQGIQRLLRVLTAIRSRRDDLDRRWQGYPCKGFFRSYPEKLREVTELVQQAGGLMGQESIAGYGEAEQLLGRAHQQAVALEGQWPEMAWMWNTLEFLRRFAVRLAVAEGLALLLGLLAVPLLAVLVPAGRGGIVSTLEFRRFVFVALVALLAPAGALLASLVSGSKVKIPA